MNLLIRADSSSQIGLGHIMRDLVLAEQYPNACITFACQDLPGNMIDLIPYPVHILISNTPEELIDLIRTLNINRVIFDHYDIHAEHEKTIKEQTNVSIMSLDDMYASHHCDILLNHNISADVDRYIGLVPSHCVLRCGAEYTLIRDEFKTEKQIKREKIYDLFVSMGGTDPTSTTLCILKTLNDDLRVCVVTTSGNPNLNELQNFAQERKNITLKVDSKRIAQLLNQSRLAIISPSVIVQEVLFMEIPFIAIKTAANQDDIYQYLLKNKFNVMETFNFNKLIAYLERLLK